MLVLTLLNALYAVILVNGQVCQFPKDTMAMRISKVAPAMAKTTGRKQR